jgi:itaconate CoA-transferase
MKDVWSHPQLRVRERWTQVSTPEGMIPALLPPAVNNEFTPRMDPVPSIGEHSDGILSKLGYSHELIEQLRKTGVI